MIDLEENLGGNLAEKPIQQHKGNYSENRNITIPEHTPDDIGNGNLVTFYQNKLIYNKNGKCINAFEILSSTESLIFAYDAIKSNPGNMVKGTDDITLDGISREWFEFTSLKLRDESYTPKPVRRVYIPKTNGKLRPLGIASPRDKIIQQSLLFILTIILDPSFKDSSHGFRPGRSCHSAIKQIREWRGVSWFIEGDIKSFFDNIDHSILEKLLKKHFEDAKLIHLFWKFVKAGYIEWDNKTRKFSKSLLGVPQGSIISPILSNLILHELDCFVENIKLKKIEDNKNIKPTIRNKEYLNLSWKINHRSKKIIDLKKSSYNWALINNVRKELSMLRKRRNAIKSLAPNPKFSYSIEYVRYADDWLIGVWGKKKDATLLKQLIGDFLKSINLELSEEKTLITNARENRANFLGVGIKKTGNNKGATLIRRRVREDNRIMAYRIPTQLMWMTIPMKNVLEKLKNKRLVFMKPHKANPNKLKPSPRSITDIIPLPARDIILRYRSIMAGFTNFFSFADDKPRLHLIHWILKESLLKTFGRKFKLGRRKILKRYGENLAIKYKTKNSKNKYIDFSCPDLSRNPMLFNINPTTNPLSTLDWRIRTTYSFDNPCVNCNSLDQVEMHHIKHIKTINVKLNEFDKKVAAINRKQVPLCRKCHDLVHSGQYKGLSLKYYKKRGPEEA